jgi:hypothetical protein
MKKLEFRSVEFRDDRMVLLGRRPFPINCVQQLGRIRCLEQTHIIALQRIDDFITLLL